MISAKILSEKNQTSQLFANVKPRLSAAEKENADSLLKKRTSMSAKSRPQSLAKEEPSSFTIYEEENSPKDAALEKKESDEQTSGQENQGPSLTDEEKTALNIAFVTSEEPPPEYWKILAETRRQALAETLRENQELHGEVEEKDEEINNLKKERDELIAEVARLKEEMAQMEDIVRDAKNLSEMLQDVCADE